MLFSALEGRGVYLEERDGRVYLVEGATSSRVFLGPADPFVLRVSVFAGFPSDAFRCYAFVAPAYVHSCAVKTLEKLAGRDDVLECVSVGEYRSINLAFHSLDDPLVLRRVLEPEVWDICARTVGHPVLSSAQVHAYLFGLR